MRCQPDRTSHKRRNLLSATRLCIGYRLHPHEIAVIAISTRVLLLHFYKSIIFHPNSSSSVRLLSTKSLLIATQSKSVGREKPT